MSELLAVEGCVLDFTVSPSTGTITIIPASVTSNKVKCNNNKIYQSISFTVTNYTDAVIITSGTGAGVITGSATKVNTEVGTPIREGDQVSILITDSVGSPPPTTTVTVYVKDAGQTKARAE